MVIGCARIMGIRFPQNFLMPYSSLNIAEFWRRWHVTMSSWFRDYLFLPLEMGGRAIQKTNVRAARSIMITMLLCGLWHGASWNFVFWGAFHGLALVAYQVYASGRPYQVRQGTRCALHPAILAARALTLSVVMIGWIMFGTSSLQSAFIYLWRMFTWATDGVPLGSYYIAPLTVVVLLAHVLINKDRNLIEELLIYSIPVRVFTYACLMMALTLLVPSEAVPFLYVRF
jgi:alginate O-acetyltransferase complex protein AlgI